MFSITSKNSKTSTIHIFRTLHCSYVILNYRIPFLDLPITHSSEMGFITSAGTMTKERLRKKKLL